MERVAHDQPTFRHISCFFYVLRSKSSQGLIMRNELAGEDESKEGSELNRWLVNKRQAVAKEEEMAIV